MVRLIFIALLTIIVAVIAFCVSAAGALRYSAPELALRIAPWDAGAAATLAGQIIAADPSPNAATRALALSQSALRRQMVSAGTVRIMASSFELKGEGVRARRLMEQSERLSRRDMLAQLWMIEYFSQKGDVARALHHYGIAMAANDESLPILFPVLIQASSDPDLTQPLIRFFISNRDRAWRDKLMNELVTKAPDMKQVARIGLGVLNPKRPADAAFMRVLIDRAAANREFDAAYSVYEKAVDAPAIDRVPLRNGDFSRSNSFPPFDWTLADSVAVSAVISAESSHNGMNALFVRTAGETFSEFASQLVKLTPGQKRLTAAVTASGLGRGSAILMTLRCLKPSMDSELAQTQTELRTGTQTTQLLVQPHANCAWYRLAFTINAREAIAENTLWINRVAIAAAPSAAAANASGVK